MNISGQPRAPIIDFDFDLPNVNADEKQMVRSIVNSEQEMNQQVIIELHQLSLNPNQFFLIYQESLLHVDFFYH